MRRFSDNKTDTDTGIQLEHILGSNNRRDFRRENGDRCKHIVRTYTLKSKRTSAKIIQRRLRRKKIMPQNKEFRQKDVGAFLQFDDLETKEKTKITVSAYQIVKAQLDDLRRAVADKKDITPLAEKLGITVETLKSYMRKAKREIAADRARKTRQAKQANNKADRFSSAFPGAKKVLDAEIVD